MESLLALPTDGMILVTGVDVTAMVIALVVVRVVVEEEVDSMEVAGVVVLEVVEVGNVGLSLKSVDLPVVEVVTVGDPVVVVVEVVVT